MANIFPVCIFDKEGKSREFISNIIGQTLSKYGINSEIINLFDNVKIDLNKFTLLNYGISSYTKDIEEFDLIFPMLNNHENIMRCLSRGTHWTKLATQRVNDIVNSGAIPIILDCKFDIFQEDEHFWCKSIIRGKSINIFRTKQNILNIYDFQVKIPPQDNVDLLSNSIKLQLRNLFISIDKNILKEYD